MLFSNFFRHTKNPDAASLARLGQKTLLLAAGSLTILSGAGYLGKLHLLLELTSHFRLQYLVATICLMLLFFLLARQSKIGLALCAFCLVINLAEIVPWYLPGSGTTPSISGSNIKVLLSNVNQDNQNYSQVISLVRQEQPDLALFIEINKGWSAALAELKDILPYSLSFPQTNYHGIAMYSKKPLENVAEKLWGFDYSITIIATVNFGVQPITFLGTHPLPPVSSGAFAGRNTHLVKMSDYINQLATPTIVIGDLNITMWSPHYKDFIAATGMRNARAGFGIQPTWYHKSPIFYIPIDHCLVSPEIQVLNSRVGENVGSDHLPIIVDLAIPSSS
ncbi:endonuclease/exonuclease/phosphatase family protein [[Phormidium] sp. ETS-05]|uniref:endonuclease/exonuclease/phosphatase family protein n=1 Tax=[Phormidium] sp. ETS-05 TaxID=222819 RepID=UPI0018EF0764|nr:endonuclease/exonuclease/phosphatase family protein [[Phormidium] sp. ETS-05]